MNFKVVEGYERDFSSIYDDFVGDYLFCNDLSVRELQLKYKLTTSEFRELCTKCKREYGYSVRPRVDSKNYCKHEGQFKIQKMIDSEVVYFGSVPNRRVARRIVSLCALKEWDVDVCKEIVANWRKYCF